MTSELARERAAQIWCKPETSHISMEPALAEAFAEMLDDVWTKAWLGNATTAELLAELQCRAEIGGYATYKTVEEELHE